MLCLSEEQHSSIIVYMRLVYCSIFRHYVSYCKVATYCTCWLCRCFSFLISSTSSLRLFLTSSTSVWLKPLTLPSSCCRPWSLALNWSEPILLFLQTLSLRWLSVSFCLDSCLLAPFLVEWFMELLECLTVLTSSRGVILRSERDKGFMGADAFDLADGWSDPADTARSEIKYWIFSMWGCFRLWGY